MSEVTCLFFHSADCVVLQTLVTVLIENGIVDESARLWSDLHLKSLQDVLVLFQTVFEKSG